MAKMTTSLEKEIEEVLVDLAMAVSERGDYSYVKEIDPARNAILAILQEEIRKARVELIKEIFKFNKVMDDMWELENWLKLKLKDFSKGEAE